MKKNFSFKSTKFSRTYKLSLWWGGKWDTVYFIYIKYISDCPVVFLTTRIGTKMWGKIDATLQMDYLTLWSEAPEINGINANYLFLKWSSLINTSGHLWAMFPLTCGASYMCITCAHTHMPKPSFSVPPKMICFSPQNGIFTPKNMCIG